MDFFQLIFIFLIKNDFVYSLIIEDSLKLCSESICNQVNKIEIPEKTDICTKDILFSYNNNKNKAFFSSNGNLLFKSIEVPCESKKKFSSFTLDDKTFNIVQFKNSLYIEYVKSNGDIISSIDLEGFTMETIFAFIKNNLYLFLSIVIGVMVIVFIALIVKFKYTKMFNNFINDCKKRYFKNKIKVGNKSNDFNTESLNTGHVINIPLESSAPEPQSFLYPNLQTSMPNLRDSQLDTSPPSYSHHTQASNPNLFFYENTYTLPNTISNTEEIPIDITTGSRTTMNQKVRCDICNHFYSKGSGIANHKRSHKKEQKN
jgi:hypothetical protein